MKISRRKLIKTAGGTAAALLCQELTKGETRVTVSDRLTITVQEAKDGKLLPMERAGLEDIYLMDLDYNPLGTAIDVIGPGKLSAVRPNKPFAVAAKLHVPGFGICRVYADVNGKGYDPSSTKAIWLNNDLADNRLSRISSYKERAEKEGIVFSSDLESRLKNASAKLEKSRHDTAQTDISIMEALAGLLWAGELFSVERAKQRIAKFEPRKDFFFGCNAFRALDKGEGYTKPFYDLFNFCTFGIYWSGFEKERGKPYYGLLDQYIQWARAGKIKPKGHPLVWANTTVLPEWLTEEDIKFENFQRLCAERVKDIVSRYKERIDVWDVINEAHDWLVAHGYTYEQMLELTSMACTETRKANPNAVKIVNSTMMWAGEYVAPKAGQPVDLPLKHTPHRYIRDLLARGVDLDVIGIQLYYPERDMFEIDLMLERFARFGKPIHITELGVASETTEDGSLVKHPFGLWHEPWSEKVQADWMEQFYTIAYSKPYIKALTWWDFADIGHFWPHGGWLTPDLKQKEICTRFAGLLKDWRLR